MKKEGKEGARLPFDEESRLLYDAVAPTHTKEDFEGILGQISTLLPPGEGSLIQRYTRFKEDFVIPKDRLDVVFKAAIAEARKRTLARCKVLPPSRPPSLPLPR